MQDKNKITIFLVDDDALFLKLMEIEFLQHPEFSIETYPSGELCMENISHDPDVIVLDYHLDGMNKNAMNGIETLHKIKAFNPEIQVIILSQQDAIDIAINAMQYKAIDYVVKSENSFLRIEKIVTNILNLKKMGPGWRMFPVSENWAPTLLEKPFNNVWNMQYF